jgi:hypothetical protein
MTTTNDGGPADVHPMVMKAARAWCDSIAHRAGIARDGYWANWKDDCIASAQAALTECGALESFKALEGLLGQWQQLERRLDAVDPHRSSHRGELSRYRSCSQAHTHA